MYRTKKRESHWKKTTQWEGREGEGERERDLQQPWGKGSISKFIRLERYKKVRSGISRQALSELSSVCEDWCADKNSCMSELRR